MARISSPLAPRVLIMQQGMVWLLGVAGEDVLKLLAEGQRGIVVTLGGERPGGLRDKLKGEGEVRGLIRGPWAGGDGRKMRGWRLGN